jgi:N-acetylglucosamine-6-sulfatase
MRTLLSIFCLSIFCSFAQAAKKPNVVFILTDDQRWDALSCMGAKALKTPRIDQLAAEGVLFKNHFCTTSLCSPSRASILGGLYAHKHGVVNNFTDYPRDLPTFPRQLQKAGYETAYIGKWHMESGAGILHRGRHRYVDRMDGRAQGRQTVFADARSQGAAQFLLS